MKDYIGIIFGNMNSERKVYDIMMSITPVVNSEAMKFHYNETSIVFHFESDESQSEIFEYIKTALHDEMDMLFVTETNNMSIFMDSLLENHLMNLTESENSNMVIDMDKVRKGEDGLLERDLINLPIVFDSDEDDDDDQIKILQKKSKKPSLDDILDKIGTEGFDALSKTEIQILNSYNN